MYGLKKEWDIEPQRPECRLEDYMGAESRWCPGCGDHAVLNAVQRLARDKQLPPEKTMVVSGIGCSSRFPHYMKTYGFHGLHGRALPVACGIRARRPDLHMFVVTGDGDCCAIGTAHWIHAIRYNMDLTILLLDNNIYGLTKNQTSPTTRSGERSNTHPRGSFFAPLNPLSVVLGIANRSFVAQTVDFNPPHLYATIRAAFEHKGASFVRILQRCPHFTSHVFAPVQQDMSQVLLLDHAEGVSLDDPIKRMFPNRMAHNPSNLSEARDLADRDDVYPIGVLYKNPSAWRYDEATVRGLGMPETDKLAAIDRALDRFMV
ncbi:MAG TPA: thiamine pyrophosphate-dependent enzyme [Bryobacteraceae bacterium]|nr:thiamine pyrophosphate-dependent enzyme [Bryobacteraceae bacterium]